MSIDKYVAKSFDAGGPAGVRRGPDPDPERPEPGREVEPEVDSLSTLRTSIVSDAVDQKFGGKFGS